jgi:hypothetical protein
MFVRHPDYPEWGLGQVQSRAGILVTINFTDAGKKVINAEQVILVLALDASH